MSTTNTPLFGEIMAEIYEKYAKWGRDLGLAADGEEFAKIMDQMQRTNHKLLQVLEQMPS